jgi:hypothetical protein
LTKWLSHVLIPMGMGIIIYLFFRDKDVLILHEHIPNLPNYNFKGLSNFCRYNLPDGLWLYASCMAMSIIWQQRINKHSLFWIICIPILAFSTEGAQWIEPSFGTFDICDMAIYIGATWCALYQCKLQK